MQLYYEPFMLTHVTLTSCSNEPVYLEVKVHMPRIFPQLIKKRAADIKFIKLHLQNGGQ